MKGVRYLFLQRLAAESALCEIGCRDGLGPKETTKSRELPVALEGEDPEAEDRDRHASERP